MNRHMELQYQVECLQDIAVVSCSGRIDVYKRQICGLEMAFELTVRSPGIVPVLPIGLKVTPMVQLVNSGRVLPHGFVPMATVP